MSWFKKEERLYGRMIECTVGLKKMVEFQKTFTNIFNFDTEDKILSTCGFIPASNLINKPAINISVISQTKNGSRLCEIAIASYNLVDIITLQHMIEHLLKEIKIKYQIKEEEND